MGGGASTAAFRGKHDSSTGQRARTAVAVQGQRCVDPTRDSKTGRSRNSKSTTIGEGGGGEVAPLLCLAPTRTTTPCACVLSPSDTSIRAIALRHLAALSLLESSKFTEDDSLSKRTLQHRVFGSWTNTTFRDPLTHGDHRNGADRFDYNYDCVSNRRRAFSNPSFSVHHWPDQKVAAASRRRDRHHKPCESKSTPPQEVWLSNANKEEARSSCSGDEVMTKEEAARWLNRPNSSHSCSPRAVDSDEQRGADESTILPPAPAPTVATTWTTGAAPTAREEEQGKREEGSWAPPGRCDDPDSLSEAEEGKDGRGERGGVVSDDKLVGSVKCGANTVGRPEYYDDNDYDVRTMGHASVGNTASRTEHCFQTDYVSPARHPIAGTACVSPGRLQEENMAISRAGRKQPQMCTSIKTTSSSGQQSKDDISNHEICGNEHYHDGQISPSTITLLSPAGQRHDRQGRRALSNDVDCPDRSCPVPTRKPSRVAHHGSFSTSLHAAMKRTAKLGARSPSAPKEEKRPNFSAKGRGAMVGGKRGLGALAPLRLTIPRSTHDQPAFQQHGPDKNGTERGGRVWSAPRKPTSGRTKPDWISQSGLLDDDEWVQLSDEEEGETEPSSPTFQKNPSPGSLGLSTKREHQVSYHVTENGSIILSGFQSPIPQSGLAAATFQNENLAQTSAMVPRGNVDHQDPISSTAPFAGRIHGSGGAGGGSGGEIGDIRMLTEGGQADGTGALGGVVTPMQERVVLLGKLGEGATGVVYRAFDLFDLRLVAVKVIPVNDQNKRRQLVQEILSLYDGLKARRRRASAAVLSTDPNHLPTEQMLSPRSVMHARHWSWPLAENADNKQTTNLALSDPLAAGSEHILELIDVFFTKATSTLSLVVEYMDGGSLQDLVNSGGCQDEETLGHMALQALQCLRYLHASKKIHRDLKPANILLNRKGELKIGDFGLTRTLGEEGEEEEGEEGDLVKQQECTDISRDGVRECNGVTNKGVSVREAEECHRSRYDGGSESEAKRAARRTRRGPPAGPRGDGGGGSTPERTTTKYDTDNREETADVDGQESGTGGGGGGGEKEAKGTGEGERTSDRLNSNTPLSRAHTFVGTVTYMSPERINGDGYSYASDIWSLGMSLLTTALGKLPLETKHGYWGILHSIRDADPPTLPDDGPWSPEFREFINLCLQKDAARRADCETLAQTAFIRRAAVTWEASARSCDNHLLEGEIRQIQTQELKSTLSTIAKHIKSLIAAAESRASAGESPCPSARGGLGRISEATPPVAPCYPDQKDGGMTAAPQSDVAISGGAGRERRASGQGMAPSAITATTDAVATAGGVLDTSAKSMTNTPASKGDASVEVIARTRVLRRVSSVRQLLLGANTRGGERLEYFSRQLGLPHDVVVACFEESVSTIEDGEETDTFESTRTDEA